jgi:hypothetical protein
MEEAFVVRVLSFDLRRAECFGMCPDLLCIVRNQVSLCKG